MESDGGVISLKVTSEQTTESRERVSHQEGEEIKQRD